MSRETRGFSLIELLIASLIFTVVLTVVYSAFNTGMFGYKSIEKRLSVYQKARRVLDRASLDLRNAFGYSDTQIKFIGSGDRISFFSIVKGRESARNYARVSYFMQEDNLMRLCLLNQQSLKGDHGLNPQRLASGIEEFVFSFASISTLDASLAWKDSWDDPKKFPAAVKVKISFKENPHKSFSRIIYFP
jgi:prepilin-type N-terminal cleavage/methylation domain-containing protein